VTGFRDERRVSQRAEVPGAREEGDNPMNPPSYPSTDDAAADEGPRPSPMGWGARIGLAAVVVVIVLIVVLHLTGVVGPAAN